MIKYNILCPTDNEIYKNLESVVSQVGANLDKAKQLLNTSFLALQAYLNTCAIKNQVNYIELNILD
nr:MAG TPA: hypothetical protein [Caudoviricetes sp.]